MRCKKFLSLLLSCAVAVSATSLIAIEPVNADDNSVAINERNFPDIILRQYVEGHIDGNQDGFLSQAEIDAVTEIDINGYKYGDAMFTTDQVDVLDITGIEYFTNLECLNLNRSYGSTSLDLTGNKKLVEIRCSETPINSININGLKDLEVLQVNKTNLTSLDVSTNINLRALECQETYITELDLRNNPTLSGEYAGGSFSQSRALRADLENDYYDFTRSAGVGEYYSFYGINQLYLGNSEFYYDFFRSIWNDGITVQYCKASDLNSLLARTTDLKYVFYNGDGSTTINTLSNLAGVSFLYLFNVGNPTIDISNNSNLKAAYGNDVSEYLSEYFTGVSWEGEAYNSEVRGYIFVAHSANVVTTLQAPVTTQAPTTTPAASSEGGVSGFVERLYTVALGRNSDPVGQQQWVDTITSGQNTGADVARGFLYSPEFLNKNSSDEEFVRTLYRTFFGREADEGGLNAWTGVLANGEPRQNVIEGFINSTEWANLCLSYGIASGGTGTPNVEVEPNQATIDFATRLYTTCLNRDADQNGLMAWARQLANQRDTGTGAARGFFFSSEFTNQNVSNEEYVNRLYRTFMGREADESGFNAWVGQLNSGVSREDVFNGFAQSQEFGAICASYGIMR